MNSRPQAGQDRAIGERIARYDTAFCGGYHVARVSSFPAEQLRERISRPPGLLSNVPLREHTTLLAGGAAEWYYAAYTAEELAEVACLAQSLALPYVVLGLGSNVLVSDKGVRGLVIHARCARIDVGPQTTAECGAAFQDLFLKSAQASLAGLSFAVGIPGTVGGALVSNAGAYRSNIGDLVESIEVAEGGERKRVGPDWMEFAYRDSCLRRGTRKGVLLRVTLRLEEGSSKEIYEQARDFQRQREAKQPPGPSAGSFFKNVYSKELAGRLPDMPDGLREAGVVPAGYLIAAAGLKGTSVGGACVSHRHANYLLNTGGATAAAIRALAERVKAEVHTRFGVMLEEEVLYLGDW